MPSSYRLLLTLALLGVARGAWAQVQVTSCSGEFSLAGPAGFAAYVWTPATGLRSTTGRVVAGTVTQPTRYTVEASDPTGPNLIANGDFEAGNRAFTSDYAFSPGASATAGTYGVVESPASFRAAYQDCAGPRGIGGRSLVADGGSDPARRRVWCQAVTVTPGQRYRFAYAHASLTSTAQDGSAVPARFAVTVNGVQRGAIVDGNPDACDWREATVAWTAPAASVNVCISNLTPDAGGNDFALDDLELRALGTPTTEAYDVSLGNVTTNEVEVEICPGGRWTEYGKSIAIGGRAVIRLVGQGGCDSIVTYRIVDGGLPRDSAAVTSLCSGEVYAYQPASGEALQLRRDTTVYEIVRLPDGCDSTFVFTARFLGPGALSPTIVSPSCAGDSDGSLSVTVGAGLPGFTYAWDDGATASPTRRNLTAGEYGLEVTDALGCSARRTFTVPPPPELTVDISGLAQPICPGELGVLNPRASGGTGAVELAIADENGAEANPAALPAGDYVAAATDDLGCTARKTFTVESPPAYSLTLTGDTLIRLAQEGTYELDIEGGERTLTWSYGGVSLETLLPGVDLSTNVVRWRPARSGVLRVRATDDEGCIAETRLPVRLQGRGTRFFPSAFSPNGDDNNDVFGPAADPGLLRLASLRVLDRWGNLLYQQTDCPLDGSARCGWDGTVVGGGAAEVGVYVFDAEVTIADGTSLYQTGEVFLAARR